MTTMEPVPASKWRQDSTPSYRVRVLRAAADGRYEIPSLAQNLIRTNGPDVEWVVERPSGVPADAAYFTDVYAGPDRVIARADDRFYEIDPDDGTIRDDWSPSAFVVGGQRHSFADGVEDVAFVDGVTILRVGSGRGPEAARLVGLDDQGDRIWDRRHRAWTFDDGEHDLRLSIDWATRKGTLVFALDPHTGQFVRALRAPPEYVQSEIDFEAISSPFVHVWSGTTVCLFDAAGGIVWQRHVSDGSVTSTLRSDEYTILCIRPREEGNATVLRAVAGDGSLAWERSVGATVSLAETPAGPRIVVECGNADDRSVAFDVATGDGVAEAEGNFADRDEMSE